MRSQFRSIEELSLIQERQLRLVITYALATSPWYEKRLRELPSPERFTLDDLRRLPILEREDLQGHLEAISGEAPSGSFVEVSGGSTGRPVRLFHTQEHFRAAMAELERDDTMCNGYQLHERQAFLWGVPRPRRPSTYLRDAVMNRLWLGGLTLEDGHAAAHVARLRAYRPRLLVGYVSMLIEIARSLPRPIESLRAIQASAETLTDANRSEIEEAFGAPVYNRYGAREVGTIAHECDAHDGMHLLMENNLVEVVDTNGIPLIEPGAEGDVVVTSLTNLGTPLLRYRLGDVARVGKTGCTCGRGSTKLEAVLGRTSGIIVAPNGRRLHGEFFTHHFYGEPVRRFRVEQVAPTALFITVIPDVDYTDAVRERIVTAIAREGDADFNVDWQIVQDIPTTATGKFQFTVNHVTR